VLITIINLLGTHKKNIDALIELNQIGPIARFGKEEQHHHTREDCATDLDEFVAN
jgi:hypothetical protein